MAINVPVISNLLFYPMKKEANYIYSHADDIIAVSKTYVERGLSVNSKVQAGLSVFLGTDLHYFDQCVRNVALEDNSKVIKIAYIGTLGTSYDIKSVIDAISILNTKGYHNLHFVVMGDGPLKNEFENYAKGKSIHCEFTGRLDYEKMVRRLCSCDIAVNPIVGKSVASIINKVGDYAAAGLPVINTQNSAEYRKLIEQYHAGYNCQNGNANDIADKIEILMNNKEERIRLGKNTRKLAEEEFDRNKTYQKIIERIGC